MIVYFASRKAPHQACKMILDLKIAGHLPFSRSVIAVRNQLDDIRQITGLWDEQTGRDIVAVDAWLVNLGVPNLGALTEVGREEFLSVPEVCQKTLHSIFD